MTSSLPPSGTLITDDDGERVQCHLCGTFWRNLGLHARHTHHLDPDTYREQFGLNRGQPLASPGLRARQRDLQGDRLRYYREVEGVIGVPIQTRPDAQVLRSLPVRQQGRQRFSERTRETIRETPPERRAEWVGKMAATKRGRPNVLTPEQQRTSLAAARQAFARKMTDPEQHAHWRQAISDGRLINRRLTDEQIATAAERVAGGASIKDVAADLGVERRYLGYWLKRSQSSRPAAPG